MDAEMAKNFYENHEWFRRFFEDLEYLLADRVKAALPKEYEMWQVFEAKKARPVMTRYYDVCFYRKNQELPIIHITALLGRQWDNEEIPQKEPLLMVMAYNGKERWRITNLILDGDCEYKPSDDGMSFSGTDSEKKQESFRGFFVPLDAFSDRNCPDEAAIDKVIQEKIVAPLKEILNKHFPDTGRKTKTRK